MTSKQTPRAYPKKDSSQKAAARSEQQISEYETQLPQLNRHFDPRSLTPRDILQLQRTIGNQSVQRLLAKQPAAKNISILPASGQTKFSQRKISEPIGLGVICDAEKVNPNSFVDPRGLQELQMLSEVISEFYPNGTQRPSRDIAQAIINTLNAYSVINRFTIRRVIADIHADLGIQSPGNGQLPQVTDRGDVFIQQLQELQGSYNWASGESDAFKEWIYSPNQLPVNGSINCWEAILISAACAGLIPLADLQQAYDDPKGNVQGALFNLLNQKTVDTILNTADPNTDKNNLILPGDIILLDGADGPLTHVVAVLTSDTTNYDNVMAASLWTAGSNSFTAGGSLTQSKLGTILKLPAFTNREFRIVNL
jgi:hypothetical protein